MTEVPAVMNTAVNNIMLQYTKLGCLHGAVRDVVQNPIKSVFNRTSMLLKTGTAAIAASWEPLVLHDDGIQAAEW